MTVINSTEHYLFEHAKCSVCRGELKPPFVSLDGAELAIVRICTVCCKKLKNGLSVDMVQVSAISEMHDLGYHGMTLVRQSRKQVEADERKRKEFIFNPEL